MSDVTLILSKIEAGDPTAAAGLLPLVYRELRGLAAARMAAERPDHTLQATALVHEAYIRLVDVKQAQHWKSREHFFAAAAEAMRRILVETARRRRRLRHGGDQQVQSIEDADQLPLPMPSDQLVDLDEALVRLDEQDPAVAGLVKLRFFVGMTLEEIAQMQGRSLRTVNREWSYAKMWLLRELSRDDAPVA